MKASDFLTPPEPQGGYGFINLKQYVGNDVLVKVVGEASFNTRFGERGAKLIHLRTTKQAETGYVMAAQFLAMETGKAYAGHLERDGMRWILKPIDSKRIEAVLKSKPVEVSNSAGVLDDDVPF